MKTLALPFALACACGFTPPSLPSVPSLSQKSEAAASLEDQAAHVGAAAAADAVVPDPDPPAHMGPDGKPEGPGGPLSDAPADCGPEHNHCLRGNGYFLTSYSLAPVFKFSGKWYTWKGKLADGHVYRTRPATAATIGSARFLFVYREPPTGKATFKETDVFGVLPKSEKEAVTSGQWRMLRSVYKVNAAEGTFIDDNNMTLRISSTREGTWAEDSE